MNILREGKLIDSQLGTGDILSLELYASDIHLLITQGYTMNRFMGMKHGLQTAGWAMEDKVHLWLRDSNGSTGEFVKLDLDIGGNLTYTFFRNVPCPAPNFHALEYDELDAIVGDDPSNHLEVLGINKARIYGAKLLELAQDDPSLVQPDYL